MRLSPANPERIAIHTLPSNVVIRAEQNIPAAWRELARHGVIFRGPVPVPLRAINKGFKYSFNNGKLRPGRYTLTLLATRKTAGEHTCTASVRITPLAVKDQVDAPDKPVAEHFIKLPPEKKDGEVTLRAVEIPLETTSSGNATLEISPSEGEVVVNGMVLSFRSERSEERE